ncbi:proteasome subunit alpha type 1, putative [Entamoeba histolytica HM-1:IMSS-B]|uniref:Proteasome alpha subunit, putative n=6 Tax=Entamoeba histolytica TaxID=5759 RepID=C4M363_ENTH1|nr:proteasome alpha subunit, putative [Entamoeba histolytica HM-1:IMSS]EMD46308.1 proteasome alpha subunit, putative [Entamoeba histolytica KU27]EMH76012.1 proteasome subunit alpha type 1, putative [Entamoeba histolytica HM-1:IMSS-B]EMS15256.1 proteasome alpha subunit, putative [Entamoeba histolytica HM-3:IMSS]ENY61263.1 proteasome alpha subunit, putative [Entamoeba histolytica HM-1:IMSS-A]GAT95744.1 proteasome subunit alpha type 1 putative [Entamoeba histolytica]|eukprot:XP_653086.1 proteasome alpha subunit, putative [Entamoeba histolytica HM-1:IMSS]
MFRNQYDSDNITWSPQGRLFQIEYATEAVKQGSAVVGVKSKTHAVVATFNRQTDELGAYQKKIFEIDDHIGVAISGFCADARVITSQMRSECIDYSYVYGTPHPVEKLVKHVSDNAQVNTQKYGLRPYGVGLLVIGYDTKPRLFETSPSGLYYSYKAQAIGARSQSCRTYLEKHFESFKELDEEQLIKQAILALRESLTTTNDKLSVLNCSVAIVGKDTPFRFITDKELQNQLDNLDTQQMEMVQAEVD